MGTQKKCINCHEREIYIKKRQLCNRCYQRLRHAKNFPPIEKTTLISAKKDSYKREIQFIKNFFNHSNWVHYPATFRLDENGRRYSPDFYDGERNTFIEVVGTKQAFQQNKIKYILFIKNYPKILFEIRRPNGHLLKLEDRMKWKVT